MRIQTPSIFRLGWVLVVALVVAGVVSALPAPAEAAGITLSERQGKSGTTLSESVSANGHRTRTFTWTIEKVADPNTLSLNQGDTGTVTYTVTLTKDDGTVHGSIDGEVCITNGGSIPTENLMSNIKVTQPPSTVAIVSITPLDVSAKPILGPGESHCYPYSIDIPSNLVNSGSYKVTAATTITNHSGKLGEPKGPSASANTEMPATETLVHNTVTVSDTLGGPLGEFTQGGTKTYTHSFSCEDKGDNPNTASITYDDNTSGPSDTATVAVQCTTSSGGCTLTIGYWKNHADAIPSLLPIWLGTEDGARSVKVTTPSQAVTIEGTTGSNGIDKLYAQLLAAKLNIENGADGSAVTSTIQDADNFLATHVSGDWDGLTNTVKSQVNDWASTLDGYNNGVIGPGHCP
ncbi:hypothetical protein N7527_008888 [Penicillium freii]|uniref:Uncharacterized protein n=1 Tax=Penicillium freii TaxID=48697 RepID=A0A101MEH9_PENFR|nr:hypothetical protein N7527_008888 [Penicillium freii]KUM59116.1 hypothetical protein ACN42_g8015 [Penicillium freii]